MGAALFPLILGLCSTSVQVLALRELLAVFSGNELVVAFVLGSWMLNTGLGALWQKHRSPADSSPTGQLFLLACLALLTVSSIRLVRLIIAPGSAFSIPLALTISIAALFPYCFFAGRLLVALAAANSLKANVQRVYAWDSFGGVVAGSLFALAPLLFFSPLHSALTVSALTLASSFVYQRHAPFVIALRLALYAAAVLLGLFFHRAGFKAQYPQLVEARFSPFAEWAVTSTDRQLTLFQNSIPVAVSIDAVAAEETVHYAMAQHPHPATALLVSGAFFGALDELAKYPLEHIDYLEPDAEALSLVVKYRTPPRSAQIELFAGDPRQHIRTSSGKYDVILLALPAPASAELNRFYTVEFFGSVHRALTHRGVLSINLPAPQNYYSPQLRSLLSSVYRSLESNFKHVLAIPGARTYFLASDTALTYDIAAALSRSPLRTSYVNPSYLITTLAPDRLSSLSHALSQPALPNTDFYPRAYLAQVRYWLTQFTGAAVLLWCFLAGLWLFCTGALFSVRPRSVSFALFFSGFTAITFEFISLLAVQIFYGHVFQVTSAFIAVYLGASALGARFGFSLQRLGRFWAFDALITALLVLSLAVLFSPGLLAALPPLAAVIVLGSLNAAAGFLVGAQFSAAVGSLPAGAIFSLDFLGAATGAFMTSVLIVPLVGIPGTCLLVVIIKCLTTVGCFFARQPSPEAAQSAHFKPNFRPLVLPFTALVLVIAVAVPDQLNAQFYSFTFDHRYQLSVLLLAALGLVQALRLERPAESSLFQRAYRRLDTFVLRATKMKLLRLVAYLVFTPLLFYPLVRCYFSLPYLFCHVCPRKCIFGYLRPYLIPAALITNLDRLRWCRTLCPIGTCHDCQALAFSRVRRLPLMIAHLCLAFSAVAYFQADPGTDSVQQNAWCTFFFFNRYDVTGWTMLAAAAFITAGFFLFRPFCALICPVGAASHLVLESERKLCSLPEGRHGQL